jgi:hypothetical protein
MSKPHIILHIGAEKTGSTTLQRSLSVLAPRISQTIRYPMDNELPDTDHGRHAGLVKASGCKWYWLSNNFEKRTYAIREAYKAEYFDKLRALAAASYEGGLTHLLLSEENLSSRLKITDVENLTNEFDKHFDNKTIVLLMREQFSAYVSQYSTFVRYGKTDEMRKYLLDHMHSEYFDYYHIIKKWEACGWAVELGLHSATAIPEFTNLLFKITGDKIEIPQNKTYENLSLTYHELNLMRHWNKLRFPKNKLFMKFFYILLRIARKSGTNPDYSQKFKDIKEEMCDHYHLGNSIIARKYFNRNNLFGSCQV